MAQAKTSADRKACDENFTYFNDVPGFEEDFDVDYFELDYDDYAEIYAYLEEDEDDWWGSNNFYY